MDPEEVLHELRARVEAAEEGEAQAREVLRGYETWEADVILNADWGRTWACLTEAQVDTLIMLQQARNRVLNPQETPNG